jgi:hypothetical protein
MSVVGFALVTSGALAALITIGALQAAAYVVRGRVWEIAIWTLATVVTLAGAGWVAVAALMDAKPPAAVVVVLALAPLAVTLGLIARTRAAEAFAAAD